MPLQDTVADRHAVMSVHERRGIDNRNFDPVGVLTTVGGTPQLTEAIGMNTTRMAAISV